MTGMGIHPHVATRAICPTDNWMATPQRGIQYGCMGTCGALTLHCVLVKAKCEIMGSSRYIEDTLVLAAKLQYNTWNMHTGSLTGYYKKNPTHKSPMANKCKNYVME